MKKSREREKYKPLGIGVLQFVSRKSVFLTDPLQNYRPPWKRWCRVLLSPSPVNNQPILNTTFARSVPISGKSVRVGPSAPMTSAHQSEVRRDVYPALHPSVDVALVWELHPKYQPTRYAPHVTSYTSHLFFCSSTNNQFTMPILLSSRA